MDEKKLAKAMIDLKEGDSDALAVIYEETRRGVFTFVLPIMNDYQLAEDVMQNTYIRLFENISKYDKGKNPLNWILTMAKNLALTALEKEKRTISYDFDDDLHANQVVSNMPEEFDTPLITLASEVLSPSEFHIVMMFAVGGYKHREIAEMLHLPLGTVTWKYSNAIKKIREAAERKGLGYDA